MPGATRSPNGTTPAASAIAAWDNLLLGLRLGDKPRVLATTTPRAVPLVRRLLDEEDVAVTRGGTEDNAGNLPVRFIRDMRRSFGKSLLGRQELDGELIEDLPGALWTRALLEQCRETAASAPPARVVIGVDPPASAGGDACGIVVCALGDGRRGAGAGRCLGGESPSPERWARAVAASGAGMARRPRSRRGQPGRRDGRQRAARRGIRAAAQAGPRQPRQSRAGRAGRGLYEAGRVRHAGMFPALEDELCGLI